MDEGIGSEDIGRLLLCLLVLWWFRLQMMMHAQWPPEQQADRGQCDDGVNEYSSDDFGSVADPGMD